MTAYVSPDPSVAEYVHEKNKGLQESHKRLAQLSDDELKSVLRNNSESAVRLAAMGVLFSRLSEHRDRSRDSLNQRLLDLLGDLLEDDNPDIARTSLRHCPLLLEMHIETARRQLESTDEQVKAEAAVALARIKDKSVLPKLVEWFTGGNEGYRNIAVEGLKTLNTEQARDTLAQSYENGGRDEQDRALLAIALLSMGDTRGLKFLDGIATRGSGALSVMAATWIYAEHDADTGLRLMLQLLDNGDLAAKQSLVNQICYTFMHSPHAFTADGIHEARHWVQRKLESTEKYGP